MTEQVKKFLDRYFETLNGAQSAIYAGYKENSARQQAHQILERPESEEYLQKLRADFIAKNGINKESVLNEYRKIAFSDVRKVLTVDGGLKPLDEVDEDTAGAIAAIESFDVTDKESREILGTNRKIKLHDKLRALEALSKHLGLFEKDNDQKSKAAQVTIFELPDNGRK